jgi:hypothetical protein
MSKLILKDPHIAEYLDSKVFDKYREQALNGIAWELVHDNLGIYPQSVTGGPNAYEKRTDYMEGHNACVTQATELYSKVWSWIESLPIEHKDLVVDLLIAEKIKVSLNKEIEMFVNCSDVFYWACSDAEVVEFSELSDLVACFEVSPNYGGDLWCAKKRGMRPQTACYRLYPKDQWPLFDAAGPERTDPDGKGRSALQ